MLHACPILHTRRTIIYTCMYVDSTAIDLISVGLTQANNYAVPAIKSS